MSDVNAEWRAKVNRWAIGGVVAIAVIIGVVSCVAGGGKNDPHHDLESITQCETRIGKLLKSPATAKYDSTTSAAGSDTWKVTGTVDAENGFGATVRATYACTVVIDGDTATTTVDTFDQ